MPYATHWLLQYGGTLGTTGEIWSNNIRLGTVADGDADPDEEASLVGYTAAVRNLFENQASKIGAHCTLRYLKFNKIGPDGRYVSNTEANSRFLTGSDIVAGASGAAPMPYSVSAAVTWETDFARGRGSRGRIFSPGATFVVTSEGQMDAGTCAGMASAYSGLISALNDVNPAPGDAMRAIVASGVNGARNPITAVSVGSVPDTMRSRRNKLIETRQRSTVG